MSRGKRKQLTEMEGGGKEMETNTRKVKDEKDKWQTECRLKAEGRRQTTSIT